MFKQAPHSTRFNADSQLRGFVLDIDYQVWGQDTQTKSSRLVILTFFEDFISQDNKNFILLVNHSLSLLKHCI